VNKRVVAAAVAAVLALVVGPAIAAAPASAVPLAPELVSLTFTPTTVASGQEVFGSINDSPTGLAYFAGCIQRVMNGVIVDASDLVPDPNDARQTEVSSGPGSMVNYSAENITAVVKYFLNTDCVSVTPDTVPTVMSNVVTVLPMLIFEPVTLMEGQTVASPAPYSLSGTFFNWANGGTMTVVTPNNCPLEFTDALIDEAPTPLPLGLEVTSVASDSGQPSFAFAGTVPAGSAGTYRACMSLRDDDDRTAHAWLTFTVSAPAVLAQTGTDPSALVGTSGLAAGFLAAGLALIVARRRRPTLSTKDSHARF
jgi:LPXTG-motif cell wall-anchored protein